MNIIYLLLPIALLMACGSLAAYLWCATHHQYEDLETPAHRILLEDEILPKRNHQKEIL